MTYRSLLVAVSVSCLAGLSIPSYSQNLDPTVEVSREYRARHISVDKPVIQMAVPDSVLKFDIDVDYTVGSNPYRGSYEFRPYSLDIRPEAVESDARNLFIRLGAGYSLHPTVDFVYTPGIRSSVFSMNVYGTHRSYFGRYRSMSMMPGAVSPVSGAVQTGGAGTSSGVQSDVQAGEFSGILSPGQSGPYTIGWDRAVKDRYLGYDTYTRAGVNGSASWKTGYIAFDLGYSGYAGKNTSRQRGYDAFTADFKVASNRSEGRYFYYNVDISYLYGEDKTYAGTAPYYLVEHDFSIYATLGPVFSRSSRALVDVALEVSDYGSYFSAYSGRFSLTPRYVLDKGRWFLNLGAEISVLIGRDMTGYGQAYGPGLPGLSVDPATVTGEAPGKMHLSEGQYVYPDVEIGFEAIRNYMDIYVRADGGDRINRYSAQLGRNRFFGLNYAHSILGMPLMDNTSERINARLGFKGNIGSRFMYDLNGGYAGYKNLLLDAVIADARAFSSDPSVASGIPQRLLPAVAYEDCNCYFVNFDIGWHSQDVTADASFSYAGTDLVKNQVCGFAPAPFSAEADIVYNWKKRIYIGLHCDAALARDGYAMILSGTVPGEAGGGASGSGSGLSGPEGSAGTSSTVASGGQVAVRLPGYVDLGLSAEYRFNRRMSFWLYGGNLLNMTIQRTPLYAGSGIWFTAGFTFTL